MRETHEIYALPKCPDRCRITPVQLNRCVVPIPVQIHLSPSEAIKPLILIELGGRRLIPIEGIVFDAKRPQKELCVFNFCVATFRDTERSCELTSNNTGEF